MSSLSFMLSRVEHENSFITSSLVLRHKCEQKIITLWGEKAGKNIFGVCTGEKLTKS